ncbi:hypothetical protein O181_025946 [Austropuccinia psidii MF-1]|uniref:Uncharacterized protein n=1 Tax=Austropuccinia psidii MF-1 TaxID=1389203 RepID=A0A9Q3CPG4_9BASI|nr:hypothetical protein [Austropuccinia psidii MF-1]
MPVQHSPPAKNTRPQRHQADLTPNVRAPLDCTLSVHKHSANLDRGPPMEGEAPFRRGGVKSRRSISFSGLLSGYPSMSQGPRSRLGEAEDEEVEESEETEVAASWKLPLRLLKLKIEPIPINLLSLKLNQIYSRWWIL